MVSQDDSVVKRGQSEELAAPPNDFEILAILPEQQKVLQALGSLQDNDRETIIRILDSFAKG